MAQRSGPAMAGRWRRRCAWRPGDPGGARARGGGEQVRAGVARDMRRWRSVPSAAARRRSGSGGAGFKRGWGWEGRGERGEAHRRLDLSGRRPERGSSTARARFGGLGDGDRRSGASIRPGIGANEFVEGRRSFGAKSRGLGRGESAGGGEDGRSGGRRRGSSGSAPCCAMEKKGRGKRTRLRERDKDGARAWLARFADIQRVASLPLLPSAHIRRREHSKLDDFISLILTKV